VCDADLEVPRFNVTPGRPGQGVVIVNARRETAAADRDRRPKSPFGEPAPVDLTNGTILRRNLLLCNKLRIRFADRFHKYAVM
jgi:hypothetical protein